MSLAHMSLGIQRMSRCPKYPALVKTGYPARYRIFSYFSLIMISEQYIFLFLHVFTSTTYLNKSANIPDIRCIPNRIFCTEGRSSFFFVSFPPNRLCSCCNISSSNLFCTANQSYLVGVPSL